MQCGLPSPQLQQRGRRLATVSLLHAYAYTGAIVTLYSRLFCSSLLFRPGTEPAERPSVGHYCTITGRSPSSACRLSAPTHVVV